MREGNMLNLYRKSPIQIIEKGGLKLCDYETQVLIQNLMDKNISRK